MTHPNRPSPLAIPRQRRPSQDQVYDKLSVIKRLLVILRFGDEADADALCQMLERELRERQSFPQQTRGEIKLLAAIARSVFIVPATAAFWEFGINVIEEGCASLEQELNIDHINRVGFALAQAIMCLDYGALDRLEQAARCSLAVEEDYYENRSLAYACNRATGRQEPTISSSHGALLLALELIEQARCYETPSLSADEMAVVRLLAGSRWTRREWLSKLAMLELIEQATSFDRSESELIFERWREAYLLQGSKSYRLSWTGYALAGRVYDADVDEQESEEPSLLVA